MENENKCPITRSPATFDVEMLAVKTVDLLDVKPGQVIWIWASTYSMDLIESLAYHIRSRGAFWLLRLTMVNFLQRIGQNAPEQYLSIVPEHELRWLADASTVIEVRDHGSHLPGVSLTRRKAMSREWIALINEVNNRSIRRLLLVNPTPALAESCEIPLERLRALVSGAVAVDFPALIQQQSRWVERLAQAGQANLTCPLGTDLVLQIKDRPVYQDCNSLPFGEVYTAPWEDSACGQVVIQQVYLRGQRFERLTLEFRQGRLSSWSSPEPGGSHALQELLEASSGEKDRIAELGIGLNMGLREVCGNTSLDEKIGGSVHIAIGMNEHFGGQNHSNLHLDLVIMHPSLWLDGKLVIQDGDLL